MKIHPIHALSCAFLLLLSGCSTVVGGRYDYHLVVRNIGTERISNCEITSERGFWHRPGVLIPKASASTAIFKYPYADKWTVTWKTAKGEKITKTLDLTKAFPKSFKGRLVLTIDKDNNLSYLTEKFYGP